MWPIKGWVLIEPECVGDGTGDNVHILPVEFTGRTNDGVISWHALKLETIDGCNKKVSRNPRIKIAKKSTYYDTKDGRARIISAANDLHKEGRKICANCWGHFVSDSEEEKLIC